MAQKKASGTSRNGRDSHSKRLGVKIYANSVANPGSIIIRQRGTEYHPGQNVGMGKDHTLYSLIEGMVVFTQGRLKRTYVHVQPFVNE